MGGLPVRLPTVDLQTVGAGGGSIVWRDAGGALRVGPESAGADPGPACYGRGGTRPTVTDANLLLGRLPDRLAGGLELDRKAAERALDGIDPAGGDRARERRDAAGAARSSQSSAGTTRAGSRSSRSAARGRCTRASSRRSSGSRRCSFRMRRASCPRSGSSRATSGATASARTCARWPRRASCPARARRICAIAASRSSCPCRSAAALVERFHRAHEERYGYADREREIELVAVRTADVRPGPRGAAPGRRAGRRRRARRSWSSQAPPAGSPPGGWGLGMVPR